MHFSENRQALQHKIDPEVGTCDYVKSRGYSSFHHFMFGSWTCLNKGRLFSGIDAEFPPNQHLLWKRGVWVNKEGFPPPSHRVAYCKAVKSQLWLI